MMKNDRKDYIKMDIGVSQLLLISTRHQKVRQRNLLTIGLVIIMQLLIMQTVFAAQMLNDIGFVSLPSERVQIHMDFSEVLKEELLSFTIDSPSRIVLDFLDTTVVLKDKTQLIEMGSAHSVTAIEANGLTRVVLNLVKMVPYELKVAGNIVILTLGNSKVSKILNQAVDQVAPSNTMRQENSDVAEQIEIASASTSGLHLSDIESEAHGLRLPDQPVPYLADEELPARAAPLLELGGDFLGTGKLKPGFGLPTGAVWQPRLWVYGTQRTALQHYRAGSGPAVSEWMNRLDLFGNLQLTGTERILIGFTPFHEDDQFTGQVFEPGSERGFKNNLNLDIQTLFFEGDLAELFPRWDYRDSTSNDLGFSIGRQEIVFQDGILIADTLDGVGISRNNVRFTGVPWLVNLRTTFFFGWDEIHRNDNQEDRNASLYGLFTQLDTSFSTIDFDIVYVDSNDLGGGDLISAAVDSIQRIGKVSTTFRIAGSKALDQRTAQADDGVLLFTEIAWVPPYTHNHAYIDAFVSIDNFTSAARAPLSGGPLGRTGLLFAASGIGSVPPAIANGTGDSFGIIAGYQLFFDNDRRQLLLEVGGRTGDDQKQVDTVGVGVRLQQALGRRFIVELSSYAAKPEHMDMQYGTRGELLIKF